MPDDELAAEAPAKLVDRAFGHENRMRLLGKFFDSRPSLAAENVWLDIYRLLLWIDPTIGLAHCYESDKCQPGRPWYARSLAFHTWLAREFGVTPRSLGAEIDVLFSWAVTDLAARAESKREGSAAAAESQRQAYAPDEMPLPGEDPELVELINLYLEPWLREPPRSEDLRTLATSVRLYIGQENKRKNLVGQGFEDTLAAILDRIPAIQRSYVIRIRPKLHDLPGFYPPKEGEDTQEVDLALVRKSDNHRTLVTCKWSFRSDREKQFPNEHTAYMNLRSNNKPFDYVLLTNEFDPARMASVCDRTRDVYPLFQSVVHVNPAGLLAAYAASTSERKEGGIARARKHIADGRIQSIENWLASLMPRQARASS
jgi:hypothetical protein